ncbi:phosphoribosylglycinamide formyltransferase [Sphingorhabdus sp.]|jgi:phosphoribosylglycinamide formyltransferase-1|uniref:phosphoribosylglycinamide formyltransferase n=1 Tax=Sphingorhabdus sp. TaxID=1902408 RepID=UPI003BB081A2|nr:phosphoribosylglycinamide formyltransferase [Sphingomonadales bacterium]MBK9433508.1 phosphoribosylglycinamide formyltransferase [Sphingomonadales bacterium]MBL0021738.1 phosphoribosylglycinamide formyltransferase [Sphingomonadales bacterium]
MARARVAVLISGSGTNMAALLYAAKAADCPYEIVLVASNNPDAAGLRLATSEGIPTFVRPHKGLSREVHDEIMHDAIVAAGAQFVALAGYMRILSSEFVSQWEGRMLNIHPSLLPKYKGLHTHERALEAGDAHGGCSVHLVTAELDDGPILGQTPVAILPGDTPETLAARVLIAEHQLYSRVLADYVAREQSPEHLIDQVRERALALPEADEVVSHGMPCFGIIKGKKFAYISRDHHGDGKLALLVKISGVEEQAMLIENDEDRYYRPAYFGDGWIAMRLDLGDNDWDNISDWLSRSWRAVAPKKLTAMTDVVGEF